MWASWFWEVGNGARGVSECVKGKFVGEVGVEKFVGEFFGAR